MTAVPFGVLAEVHRRSILDQLRDSERSVGELVGVLGLSQPAVSKHLRVLERAGLIERDIDKQRRPARLKAQPMAAAVTRAGLASGPRKLKTVGTPSSRRGAAEWR